MRRLYTAVMMALLLACGGKGKSATEDPGAGGGDDGRPARKEILSLEFLREPDREGITSISLVSVDETGASSRVKVGDYSGACQSVEPVKAPGMELNGGLLAARCSIGSGAGVELRLVLRRGELILLEARLDSADAEPSFEQRGTFPLPSGAKIEAAPLVPEQAPTN